MRPIHIAMHIEIFDVLVSVDILLELFWGDEDVVFAGGLAGAGGAGCVAGIELEMLGVFVCEEVY